MVAFVHRLFVESSVYCQMFGLDFLEIPVNTNLHMKLTYAMVQYVHLYIAEFIKENTVPIVIQKGYSMDLREDGSTHSIMMHQKRMSN